MEFTLEAIKEAHGKYTGVDFPKLVREFKLIGMIKNEYIIEDGLSIYINKNALIVDFANHVSPPPLKPSTN